MDPSRAQHLVDLGFQLIPLPNISKHVALERDGFVSLVSVRDDDFGESGAPGLLTENGFAAMIWRGTEAFFVARGFERRATVSEIETIRRFNEDLKSALDS
jgi:hypothetical protein